ncbi:unnamed protein product [Brassica oleracea var. botrytis]
MILCLEDLPEIERKPVKKLKKTLKMVTKASGVLERTNRHKLAQVLCTVSITWHVTGITSLNVQSLF